MSNALTYVKLKVTGNGDLFGAWSEPPPTGREGEATARGAEGIGWVLTQELVSESRRKPNG
jgi:hypothetical protein